MNRIKKGDTVEVIAGKDKGRRGRVLAVMPREGRALVEQVNLAKKHRRAKGQRDQGGRVDIEAPIPLSKLMPVSDDQATRVRIEVGADGGRQRVSVKTGKPIQ